MISVCHITIAIPERIPRLRREVQSTASAGWKNWVIYVGEDDSDNYCTYLGVPSPHNRIERMTVTSKAIVKMAMELNADIYQIHDPELLRFAIQFKKQGKIVIFDSHENYMQAISDKSWIPGPLKNLAQSMYRCFIKGVLPKIDGVLGVNRQICNSLLPYNDNVVEVANFPILKQSVEDREDRKDDEVFRLCYTGGISRQWSLRNIIEAIDGIDGVRFEFCGVEAEPGVIDELKTLPGWEKTEYKGSLKPQEALEIQKQSDAGLAVLKYSSNTNWKQGTMGNTKLFEYFMSGLPVICTDFDCWRDILDSYQCGYYINPDDVGGIREAIVNLMKDRTFSEQMGKHARKASEEKYNWGVEEKKLMHLYDSLLKKMGRTE